MTYESLHDLLVRKPFEPLRVVLTNGEEVKISRRFQAVATCRQLIVGLDDGFHWISLSQIDRVEASGIQA